MGLIDSCPGVPQIESCIILAMGKKKYNISLVIELWPLYPCENDQNFNDLEGTWQ